MSAVPETRKPPFPPLDACNEANPAVKDTGTAVFAVPEDRQAVEAAALLSAIVDSCDDAIISKNLDGIIMSWNPSAERLFGYTADEVIGQSIAILIPPERQDEEPKILEQLRRGNRVDHFETIRVRKDGARLNISLTISPVRGADGRIIGASKVARDITAQVRQDAALRRANEALRQANADLQQFAYSASHDLQEPLRMVAAYSELLKKRFGGKLGPVADEYIGQVVQGAMRMETLLDDLRNYTYASTLHQRPPDEVDAGEVLQKALSNLELAIKDSGAQVTSTALPRVRIYEFQLQQMFQNLLGNAIRYRGERAPLIHVKAVAEDGRWLFSVQDNGIGIGPEYQEQIFGIFKRLHSAAQYPGTGMGLAICKRIIERTGGRIWVESDPGNGSTFYFTIPDRSPELETSDPKAGLDSSD
jgi:PAS domain S-box-containing protein